MNILNAYKLYDGISFLIRGYSRLSLISDSKASFEKIMNLLFILEICGCYIDD